MYINKQIIQIFIEKYGRPLNVSFKIEITPEEYDRIKRSQKNDRAHDVTMYIVKDDKIVVIAKHFYPEGMFRAPSGGINPDEDFEDGAKREAREETGCEIELKKFLIITDAVFYIPDEEDKQIRWSSFVFQADYISGDFQFTDTREIREVRLAKLEDFETYSKIMRATNIGGLHYRAALHDEVKKLLTLS